MGPQCPQLFFRVLFPQVCRGNTARSKKRPARSIKQPMGTGSRAAPMGAAPHRAPRRPHAPSRPWALRTPTGTVPSRPAITPTGTVPSRPWGPHAHGHGATPMGTAPRASQHAPDVGPHCCWKVRPRVGHPAPPEAAQLHHAPCNDCTCNRLRATIVCVRATCNMSTKHYARFRRTLLAAGRGCSSGSCHGSPWPPGARAWQI